ncbi:MAG: phosphoribosylaminoimidazolesuccinocarboxamide synthase [Firmicutes bacterium]|nr:phosphoribosylaminoimidazolesuccinocarboxamide synthase [Bacillota bacterium]MBO2521833.1 phosphoribosylaminoimidazolesuccinocarboxamide synthase [Bacillota bacterium]
MSLIHDGKTKTVYSYDDRHVRIVFKDDVTGTEEGIDPGGNTVVGSIAGKGEAALRLSVYFFSLLKRHGVPTHFVSADVESRSLIAKKAVWNGLEFIVRFKAYGSFVRRFGRYVREGADLGGLVEITLKDDERGDPVIVDEAVAALGLLSLEQVREAKALARRAAEVIRDDLAEKGLELLDIKFECGIVDGRLVIIDDISTDNMRVVRDGKPVDARGLLEVVGGPQREPSA